MFVATLISARNDPRVNRTLASEAVDRAGVGDVHWLEDGVACDIVIEQPMTSDIVDSLHRLAREEAVDCVVQQLAGRRKRLLLADMDSTMIEQECIDELADALGIKDKVAGITARAMNGEIAFEPALRERVALLRDLPVSVIDEVIEKRITLAEGGRELVATMRLNGARTALVSGGFTAFTSVIAERLGFDENRANTLNATDGKLDGTVGEPILGAQAKLDALNAIAEEHGLRLADTMAVGDGANDLPMILAAGSGVAIHAKPTVAAKAPFRIDHGDLTALLFMQGYRARDFHTR
ncbi:phosphoserine phosphatase SerB [Aureimonas mangrovi]|uniref:phosphoserine phosphatase SerB n=1 Tax=Aureimonas mangrovi TaxID=2758041 RepID=UPI00163D8832|nr:phosphoserine phosphatase SerB [Aureimonas mangrovi]